MDIASGFAGTLFGLSLVFVGRGRRDWTEVWGNNSCGLVRRVSDGLERSDGLVSAHACDLCLYESVKVVLSWVWWCKGVEHVPDDVV